MKQHIRGLVCAVVLLALLSVPGVYAQDGGDPLPVRDPAREQAILDRLAALNPDAVPLFEQATGALDAGELEDARAGYEAVLALAPDFPDALRRLSHIALQQGDDSRALALAERAYTVDDSPLNQATLAAVLLADNTQRDTALAHARAAARAQPEDRYIVEVYIEAALIADNSADLFSGGQMLIALDRGDPLGHYYTGSALLAQGRYDGAIDALRTALSQGFEPPHLAEESLARAEIGQGIARDDPAQVKRGARQLIAAAPLDATGHFFLGLAHAEQEEWREAETALERARELGWPAAEIDALLDENIRAEAAADRRAGATSAVLVALGVVLVGWLSALVLLWGAGSLLSRRALHAQPTSPPMFQAAYRGVTGLAALYYALSLPLLALISVGLAVGAMYGEVVLGSIAFPLALVLIVAAAWTLRALVRGMVARSDILDSGIGLTRAEAPDLWALVDEVAARLDVPTVDAIVITPYTEISVTVRGGLWRTLRGRGDVFVLVGLGALPGLTQGQLAALLAHEAGMVTLDAAGGRLAGRVHAHLRQTARTLHTYGLARWHNPVWLFLQAYYRVFTHITRGALRAQEIRADAAAARTVGPDQFQAGLTNLLRQTLIFEAQLEREVRAAAEGRDLRTLWALPPLEDAAMEALEHTLAQMLAGAMQERFARIAGITPAAPVPDRAAPAGDLLPDLAALQAEMTRVVQARLRGGTR